MAGRATVPPATGLPDFPPIFKIAHLTRMLTSRAQRANGIHCSVLDTIGSAMMIQLMCLA